MLAFAVVTRNALLKHQLFTRIFAFKLFHVFNAIANSRSSKYFLFFLTNYFYQKLSKFEQNRMIRTTQNWDLLTKKAIYYVKHFENIVSAILKRGSACETIDDAIAFIIRQSPFILPNLRKSDTWKPSLKFN